MKEVATFRAEPDLIEALRDAAEADGRTFSAYVERVLLGQAPPIANTSRQPKPKPKRK